MTQDQGTYTPDGGYTWPGWRQYWEAGGEVMLQAREDSIAFAGTAMHPGNRFIRIEDGTAWQFEYAVPGDESQGGIMVQLKIVRE